VTRLRGGLASQLGALRFRPYANDSLEAEFEERAIMNLEQPGDRRSRCRSALPPALLARSQSDRAALVSQLSDDQLRNLVAKLERRFRDEALTSSTQAATIIRDGVKADRWRIFVGRMLVSEALVPFADGGTTRPSIARYGSRARRR
jgi:hypothetical protein